MQQSSSSSSPAGTGAQAITLDLDPGRFRISAWRNITVTVWNDQIDMPTARRVRAVSRRLAEQFPQGRSQVLMVSNGILAPDQEVAEYLRELYIPEVSRIVCLASVLEGNGFWASAIRSSMTNLRMSTGSVMTLRTFDALDEVARWLPAEHEQRTGVNVDAGELKAMLTAVHALGTRD